MLVCLSLFPPVSQLSYDLSEPDYEVMKIMKSHPSTVYTHLRNFKVGAFSFEFCISSHSDLLPVCVLALFHTVYQGQRLIIIILYRVQFPCNYIEKTSTLSIHNVSLLLLWFFNWSSKRIFLIMLQYVFFSVELCHSQGIFLNRIIYPATAFNNQHLHLLVNQFLPSTWVQPIVRYHLGSRFLSGWNLK